MNRRAGSRRLAAVVLSLLLSLLAWASCCLAQELQGEGAEQEALPPFELPNFAGRTVPGEAVAELADFISGYLSESGSLPDFMQVRTANGKLRMISAAEAFVLLARTTYLWQTMGELPATIAIAPDNLRPPLIDPEDIPSSHIDLNQGREIPSDQFLGSCGETVRRVDKLQTVPTAVWVNGERLSAVEYIAGLAICIQYAYWEGGLDDSLFLPWYAPPQSWERLRIEQTGEAFAAAPAEEEQLGEATYEEPSAGEAGVEEAGGTVTAEETTGGEEALLPALPLAGAEPGPPPAPLPELTVFPGSGSTLSGKVDLIAGYSGPPPRFVTFAIDDAKRAILNSPPYSYRWNTATETPGRHTVRVQVLGDDGVLLIDQRCAFTVVPPESQPSEKDLVDDL